MLKIAKWSLGTIGVICFVSALYCFISPKYEGADHKTTNNDQQSECATYCSANTICPVEGLICLWGVLHRNDKQIVALATLGLLIVTAFLALFTARLWDATVRLGGDAKQSSDRQAAEVQQSIAIAKLAADAAKENSEVAKKSVDSYQLSERAWVGVDRMDTKRITHSFVEGIGNDVSGYEFSIRWINSGRTPAIKTDIFSTMDHVHFGGQIPPAFKVPDSAQRHTPLLPNVIALGTPSVISDEGIKQMRDGKVKFFIYGWAEYEDIFCEGIKRSTEVCMEVFYRNTDVKTGFFIFDFSAIGPQNSAS